MDITKISFQHNSKNKKKIPLIPNLNVTVAPLNKNLKDYYLFKITHKNLNLIAISRGLLSFQHRLVRVPLIANLKDHCPYNISQTDTTLISKKVREKSRECHNHKPQPFPDPKSKGQLFFQHYPERRPFNGKYKGRLSLQRNSERRLPWHKR